MKLRQAPQQSHSRLEKNALPFRHALELVLGLAILGCNEIEAEKLTSDLDKKEKIEETDPYISQSYDPACEPPDGQIIFYPSEKIIVISHQMCLEEVAQMEKEIEKMTREDLEDLIQKLIVDYSINHPEDIEAIRSAVKKGFTEVDYFVEHEGRLGLRKVNSHLNTQDSSNFFTINLRGK